MNNPKSTDVFKVAKIFRRAALFAKSERNLNFSKCHALPEVIAYACRTSQCHGGWYATVRGCPDVEGCNMFNKSFDDGIRQMSMDLGFASSTEQLVAWARVNPTIWGNSNGGSMFNPYGKAAFISPARPGGAKTLKDIADHWQEVGERLAILEDKAKRPAAYAEVTQPPITPARLVRELSGKVKFVS